jgi:two-component system LytT family response regulator
MKTKFTAIIIDNEQDCISKLEQSINRIELIELAGTAQNGNTGKELILKIKPHILFLDIEMSDMTGFELLRDIKDSVNWPMQVIFYTAYDQYLLEALRESVFDYLLKPYTEKDFATIINRFFLHINDESKQECLKSDIKNLTELNNNTFLVTTIRGYCSIKFSDIGYIEYNKERKHWFAILKEKKIQLKRNISADDILKLSPLFAQINQQQIINISHLDTIEGKECKLDSLFKETSKLIISRNYFNTVQDRFLIL